MKLSAVSVLFVCAFFQNFIVNSHQDKLKDDRGTLGSLLLGNRPSLLSGGSINVNSDISVGASVNKPSLLNLLSRPAKPSLLGGGSVIVNKPDKDKIDWIKPGSGLPVGPIDSNDVCKRRYPKLPAGSQQVPYAFLRNGVSDFLTPPPAEYLTVSKNRHALSAMGRIAIGSFLHDSIVGIR